VVRPGRSAFSFVVAAVAFGLGCVAALALPELTGRALEERLPPGRDPRHGHGRDTVPTARWGILSGQASSAVATKETRARHRSARYRAAAPPAPTFRLRADQQRRRHRPGRTALHLPRAGGLPADRDR